MAKYYVQSGDIKVIVDAKDYKEALRKVFLHIDYFSLINLMMSSGLNILISEKGFYSLNDLEENKIRHKEKAYKMKEFCDDFELNFEDDLMIESILLIDILNIK